MTTPEQRARETIDAKLAESGWMVQSRDEINLSAGPGVAIREFILEGDHGHADYLLFVDGKAVGALEAKPAGYTLSSVELQGAKYTAGLPYSISASAPVSPLPFVYLSTGSETKFSSGLDPEPRSRTVFQFHRPETLRHWLEADTLPTWAHDWHPEGVPYAPDPKLPSSLRARLQAMPPVLRGSLYDNQFRAVLNLEKSLREDRPRSLIQMATGSGKTIMAITSIYRLIKYAGASRVLFLVDRKNLGEQAEKEFGNFRTPDDHRKFTELYNVQRLQSNTIGASSKVVISTIQRLYSMLQGEPELDPELEEESLWERDGALPKEPLPVVYNPAIPPEHFDVIFVDECHRSIYSLWRQVLDYFDAHLIGLTATPAAHTYGFFHKNLVMEYSHEEAVADHVNVDFEVYPIRTEITTQGVTVQAGAYKARDRQTRAVRWGNADEARDFSPGELDRSIVVEDQIRTIIRTFKEKLPTEIFPGRCEVPKTLIFAKDDSHAEDIVRIVREEFGKGDEFCRKITYKSTGAKPSDLIQEFRTSYYPRIAVTVDMIATGTDIKPIEIVMFMRSVRSRVHFEQMKGRGVRVVDPTTLHGVTPEALAKTHFVIVDCVGVTEGPLSDTQPLERDKSISFEKLLEHVALGGTDADYLSSLAARLARLDKQCGDEEEKKIREAAGGAKLGDIVHGIIRALDPDHQIEKAKTDRNLPEDQEPAQEEVQAVAKAMLKEAAAPLATNPVLRRLLIETKRSFEQIIDETSVDRLISAGFSEAARERARELVRSFEQFLAEKKDEIEALQFFYSQPYSRRISFADITALHKALAAPPRLLTTEELWRAYRLLEEHKVRGASGQRKLADIVSLVRYALHLDGELAPYAEGVRARFEKWMETQTLRGRSFTPPQRRWLEMIRDHIAQSLEITSDDFGYSPFVEEGGLGKARQVLGPDLMKLMDELNGALVS